MDSWYQAHKKAVSNKRKDRITRNRAYLSLIKKTNHGCVTCGFNDCFNALVFVYKYGEGIPINQMVNNAMSIESIDKALDKCRLMCFNCVTFFACDSQCNA